MKLRQTISALTFASLCALGICTTALAADAPVAKDEAKAVKPAVDPQAPVAAVGKTVITRGELERAFNVLAAQNRIQPGSTPEEQKKAQLAALDQLIYAELMYQEGLKATPADLEKQVDFKMAQNKGKFNSPADFESALKESGMTEKELAEISRKDIVISYYIDTKIAPTIKVSDDDIKKFYDENRDRLGEEPQIKASHILIGVDAAATPEVKAKAKEKAEAILAQLAAGKDFAEAAKTSSTCPSKEQGGDLGFFGKGQMVPEFEQAAFALKPGEMSGVVETQFGYHIIKVTDKKGGATPKLEELKEKIANFLKGQKTQKAVFDYVTNLKKEAKVEIML
ncbi:MAG: peptidylprolyl isomerase [Geobacter sp.]|nr:peptidylprolyl isomerase [Geobacter sp.]